ncbi:MAG TPA: alpha/beta fold hydrolase [Usitatibacter sp.]|jgi:pimeloyl-ACP methyl ester carboxylesterase
MAKLSYSELGHGLPVVLLHGFANDRSLWREQVQALASRHRIVGPDLRGFGRSPDTDGAPVSMDAYADDVREMLDALGIARAVIGGISLGGYVSLAFALRHPERVAGLVLANTRAGPDDAQAAEGRRDFAREIARRGPEAVVESYGDKPFRRDCERAVKQAVRDAIRAQPVNGLVSGMLGMAARPDRRPELGSIRVPTLVIHGTEDRFIPVEEARAMHEGIADSRYVVIDGAGHLSCIDTPGPFNAALGAFLEPIACAEGL